MLQHSEWLTKIYFSSILALPSACTEDKVHVGLTMWQIDYILLQTRLPWQHAKNRKNQWSSKFNCVNYIYFVTCTPLNLDTMSESSLL